MLKKLIFILCQVSVLILFVLAGHLLSIKLHLPIPDSVIGLLLLLVSLKLRIIRLEWVELGASFLLAEMLIFFVPAAVGVVQYQQLMVTDGLRIVIVIALSTALVMGVSGLFAEYLNRRKGEKKL